MSIGSGAVSDFTLWGKRFAVRFVLTLGIGLWVWLVAYVGIQAARWLVAFNDETPKYDSMLPPDHPEAVPLGLALIAWPALWGIQRLLRYGWKIRPLPSARFEKALLAHFAGDGWRSVRRESGRLPARGFPFALAGDHTVFAAIEKVHRGRTARMMYYGVAPVDGGDPLNRMFTIVAVFTDADSPVTMLYPQRGVAALRSPLGVRDIDTESADFNRRWRLVSQEPRAALEVMQPHVMERLLRDDAQGLTFAWDANAAMVLRRGATKDFAALERALDVLVDVADRMPAYQTKSGARGARVTEGRLTAGSPPGYRPGPVEVLLAVVGVAAMICSSEFARMIVPLDSWALGADGQRFMWGFIFFSAGVVVLLAGVFVGLARGRRVRRAWADQVNARR